MTIQEKVYLFKLKADKLDSKFFANIKLPAIITLLNEGMQALINKRYGGGSTNSRAAFDEIQKRKDEFQRLLVPDEILKMKKISSEIFVTDLSATKKKYMFLCRTNFFATKEGCQERKLKGIQPQTDDLDLMEDSSLEGSSFEWGEVLFRLAENNIRAISDSTFIITKAKIDYLRYPEKLDMEGYTHFDSSPSENKNCELPEFMHADVVEEALFIYDGIFNNPELQARLVQMANKE